MSCATCLNASSVAAIPMPRARLHVASGPVLGRLWPTLCLWVRRDRERRALAELGDRMLRDIGLTRLDSIRESRKSFWQA